SDLADELPGGRTVPRRSAWPDAVRPLSHGAACPDEPPTRQINPQCVAQRVDANRSRRTDRWRACASPAGQKREAWCMIQVSPEVAKNTQAAFERVCRALGIGTPDHYATVIVEAKITHFAN